MGTPWKIGTGLAVCVGFSLLTAGGTTYAQDDFETMRDTRAVASRGMEPRVVKAGGEGISMDLVDASLEDVLKLLSQQAGLNFVASQAVRDKRVTVYMDRVPIQTAIHSLLDANRLTFHRVEESDVFVVTESGGAPIKVTTKIYALKYARVLPTLSEAANRFGATGSLIQTGFGGTTGGSTGGTTAGAGAGGEVENQGIVAIVRQLVSERGIVTVDPRTNSIAVTDIPESFPTIDAVIERLDVKPAQIYLEAEVLEITLDTLRRLGIEYGTSTGVLATFTGPTRETVFPLGPTLLKRASTPGHTLGKLDLGNLSATLKALATEKDVKFLASPRLMTLSNEVAEIRIVADTATGLTSVSQTQTGTVTEVLERQTVGTILRVTPLVTEDKHITMVIEPEVSRVIESSKFTDFLDPNRRAARTTVMVENGGTAMIAGLLSRERERSKRKLPLLGDLPLIGAPFRRTENADKETEIVIFITPHLIPESGARPMRSGEVPSREQTPLSAQEQVAYRRYRDELLRQRRIQETLDLLAH